MDAFGLRYVRPYIRLAKENEDVAIRDLKCPLPYPTSDVYIIKLTKTEKGGVIFYKERAQRYEKA